MASRFVECASCALKSGSPTLCAACVNNRRAISELEAERDRLQRMLDVGEELRVALGGDLQAERDRSYGMRKQVEAAAHDAAGLESRLRAMIARVEASYHSERIGSSG
jgi:hypothetical protein